MFTFKFVFAFVFVLSLLCEALAEVSLFRLNHLCLLNDLIYDVKQYECDCTDISNQEAKECEVLIYKELAYYNDYTKHHGNDWSQREQFCLVLQVIK